MDRIWGFLNVKPLENQPHQQLSPQYLATRAVLRLPIQAIQNLLSAINLMHLTAVFSCLPLPYKANIPGQHWEETFLWPDGL